jgi:probable phosphoglycerate mutase
MLIACTRGVRLLVEFDGGSRGNPGNSGCGAVVLEAGSMAVLQNISGWLPTPATNNEAEYNAALLGVRAAVKLAAQLPIEHLVLQGDSLLVLNQLSGKFEVRSSNLVALHEQVLRELSTHFAGRYELKHVAREFNSRADKLANAAMDAQCGSTTTNMPLLARLSGSVVSAARNQESI